MKNKPFQVCSKLYLRTLIVCIWTFTLGLFASNTSAQSIHDVILTLELKNASVEQTFQTIEQRTSFTFTYQEKQISGITQRISLEAQKESVASILDRISSLTGLSFKQINDATIAVNLPQNQAVRKKPLVTKTSFQFAVRGTIVDEDGQPLAGASIVEKGTTNGVSADFDGNFAIEIPDSNAVLEISYIGFKTKEIQLRGRNFIDVQLLPDTSKLDEVVVVGYTEKKIKDLTGVVDVVSVEDLENVPVNNVEQALQGRVAGAQITSDGSPGGGVAVRIRGFGTLGNNDPLYIIDGVPVRSGLNNFNLNDIASIQVLKDAAATAIYGSRSANGVVIITTKKGNYGQKGQFYFDTYVGVQTATNLPEMLNTQQFGDTFWEAQLNAGLIPTNEVYGTNPQAPTIPTFIDTDQTIRPSIPGTDWFDELFDPAFMRFYNIGYQYGGKNAKTSLSLSYLNQDGVMQYSGFERYTSRINSELQTEDKLLTLGQNLSYSYAARTSFATNAALGSRVIHAYRMNPIVPLRDENGNFASSVVGVQGAENPVALNFFDRNDEQLTNRIFGNAFATLKPIEGLQIKTDFGIDYTSFNDKNYNPRFRIGDTERLVNSFSQSNQNSLSWVWNNTVRFDKTFGKHTLNFVGGTESVKFRRDEFGASRDNFFIDDTDFVFLDTGQENINNFGRGTEWSLFSLFARLDYNFNGKYLLGASIRRDGSSRFSANNKYSTFPAFSIGWRISEESFLRSVEEINDIKFRFSWGQSGNQEIGDFASFSTFATDTNNTNYDLAGNDNSVSTGFAPSILGNPNIVWETTTQTNFGLDLTLFNNAFNLTANYFIKDSEDILLQRPTLAVEGQAEPPFVNAGRIRNKGFELELAYQKEIFDGFNLKISGNGAIIDNEVLELADDVEFIPGLVSNSSTRNQTISRTFVGAPIAQIYGHVVDGIFQNQSEVDAHPDQPGKAIGRLRYRDLNQDGVIDNDDRQVIGNPHPDFIYGLNLSAAYKNFDLSLFLQGVEGVDLYNFTRYYTDFYYDLGNRHVRILNAWTPENPQTTIPRLSTVDVNNELRPSSYFIEDGSYLRLKNVQLGYTYTFDEERSRSLRLYMQATNLFTWTKYEGIDPEVSIASYTNRNRNLDLGVDRGIYPNSRVVSFGVNVKF